MEITYLIRQRHATALTINPQTLTYAADATARLYGVANPVFSGAVTGFVLSDNLSNATTGTSRSRQARSDEQRWNLRDQRSGCG